MNEPPNEGVSVGAEVELEVERAVAGGFGFGHDENGRVVLVRGGLPGERVRVEITEAKRDFARGSVKKFVTPSLGRVKEICPAVEMGCGGCDLQHANASTQRFVKRQIVEDALRRLGRVDEPLVGDGPDLPTTGYRTTVRCVVINGKAGYLKGHSHEPVTAGTCAVAHPLVEAIYRDGDFGRARDVSIRVGVNSGERLVLVDRSAPQVRVPRGVQVASAHQLKTGGHAHVTEIVHGRSYRVSARSFFQPSLVGAEALTQVVAEAAGGRSDLAEMRDATVVDLYGGVGLLAGSLFDQIVAAGGSVSRLELVERNRGAGNDARKNLGGIDISRVVTVDVDEWRPSPASLVVADPSRAGLGAKGVASVVATHAPVFVLVSCDAAALGRDTRQLGEAGYRHTGSTLVDQFPQTSHVEVVSRFEHQ